MQNIHSEAENILTQWIGHVPTDRRARQSLELFSEAVGLLASAALNLSLIDEFHDDVTECNDFEVMKGQPRKRRKKSDV